MNLIIPLIACAISLNLEWKTDYNAVVIGKRKITVYGCSNENDKPLFKNNYKIERDNDKRFFLLGKDSIYLDCDVFPVFKDSLIPYFAKRISIKQEISPRYHIYNMFFVIDKDGHIRENGFLSGHGDEIYRTQLVKVMESIKTPFVPGKVNDKNVSVLHSFELDFHSYEFREALKSP